MQWDASPAAGFTSQSGKAWLPLGDNAARNVADQREDHSSTLCFCRRLIALRHAEYRGQITSYEQFPSPRDLWVYRSGTLTVAANFSAGTAEPFDPGGPVLLSTLSATEAVNESPGGISLRPWEAVIVRQTRQ